MSRLNITETDNLFVANTYKRFPVELISGKGSVMKDTNGKEYIDMGSGIGVTAFGIADDEWKKAVTAQLGTLQHTSNLYYTEPCATLAKMLCERTGMKKVFFSNSGAESNECAIKVARKYAADKKGKEYSTIVTLKNSFHGRTITTLSATGQDKFHEHFNPLTEGFVYGDANDLQSVINLAQDNKTAAIMIECVQGEGGVIPMERDFIRGLYEFCNKEDILLVIDEVQTGNGRCGELYAYMNYGIKPDIVSTAKGLGGGLPLGATMLGEKAESVLGFGDHGSTFGGNPVCCAGAISIIERLDEKFLAEVKEKSEYIFNELNGTKGIKSVSGMGLMVGIETEKAASDVVAKCMENGVLCLTAKTKVRLLPALNIPMDVLKKAVEVIKNACAEEE
ncbi:MAG: acetylornithine/succinylornithine family transaminase [Ruminococcaceae bacterium]|nr:acetylornithine/succinylornithine family transaminase [Oscillospiraceae bacterium]